MLQGGLGDFKLFVCLLVAKGTGDAVAAAVTEIEEGLMWLCQNIRIVRRFMPVMRLTHDSTLVTGK